MCTGQCAVVDVNVEVAGPGGGGGSAILGDRNKYSYGPSLIRSHKRRLQGLRVWDSIHFGYYFYASRGDILVVKFSGS